MHALILMSDTGGGHRALSSAIAAAIHAMPGGQHRGTIVDPFPRVPVWITRTLMTAYGPTIRVAPGAYGAAFHLVDAPTRFGVLRRLLGPPVAATIGTIVQETTPDIVVFAHSLTVTPGLDALEHIGRPIPAVAMATELATIHWSWIDRRATAYFAASSEVMSALVARSIDPMRIKLTGLPVGPRFGALDEPVAQARRRLKLDPNRVTALLFAGGEGSGPVEKIVPALARAIPELQLLVVCGRNEKSRLALQRFGLPPTVHVYGFANNMAELMHAADFVFTKGGPQSISETLAAGRPAIIIGLLPGQEQGNGAYVVRRDAGYLAMTLPDVLAAARRLTSDAAERERLAAGARKHGSRHAAGRVASLLTELSSSCQIAARRG